MAAPAAIGLLRDVSLVAFLTAACAVARFVADGTEEVRIFGVEHALGVSSSQRCYEGLDQPKPATGSRKMWRIEGRTHLE